MTNVSKSEPREQMNRALKPVGIRILNLWRTILQCLCCPNFYFKMLFQFAYTDNLTTRMQCMSYRYWFFICMN